MDRTLSRCDLAERGDSGMSRIGESTDKMPIAVEGRLGGNCFGGDRSNRSFSRAADALSVCRRGGAVALRSALLVIEVEKANVFRTSSRLNQDLCDLL